MFKRYSKSGNINISSEQTMLDSSIIITPYEKVLNILNDVKHYINTTSKLQTKLVKNLDWVIKVITSHSLYAYELKEKDLINKLTKENSDFKQFVDFVSKYNEQVIEMNKKNIILGAKTIEVANDLLQKPSINLKKPLDRQIISNSPKNRTTKLKLDKTMRVDPKTKASSGQINSIRNIVNNNGKKANKIQRFNTITSSKLYKHPSKSGKNLKCNKISLMTKLGKHVNIDLEEKSTENETKNFYIDLKQIKSGDIFSLNLENLNIDLDSQKAISDSFLNEKSAKDNDDETFKLIENIKNNAINKERFSLPNNKLNSLASTFLQRIINENSFNQELLMDKEFDIFEFEKKVGHKNVLPLMGKTMLDSFGLIDEKIMPIYKIEPFLEAIASQYLQSTLYHNSLHGADITQTMCLFFNNSNAEEVCHTKAIDLLSIIIAGLGHDLGHPGLTNTFQINSSSDMAITYNDSSCLENFHLAKLFTIIRKDETNIFQKLSSQDYKKIRKKMISEILATDMAIH